jgi:hypothetical protein
VFSQARELVLTSPRPESYGEGHRLHIHFEDGVEGVVDLAEIIRFTGIFAPLQDRAYFAQMHVNPDVGIICWPNGADIDLDVLYALVTGEPVPSTGVS